MHFTNEAKSEIFLKKERTGLLWPKWNCNSDCFPMFHGLKLWSQMSRLLWCPIHQVDPIFLKRIVHQARAVPGWEFNAHCNTLPWSFLHSPSLKLPISNNAFRDKTRWDSLDSPLSGDTQIISSYSYTAIKTDWEERAHFAGVQCYVVCVTPWVGCEYRYVCR